LLEPLNLPVYSNPDITNQNLRERPPLESDQSLAGDGDATMGPANPHLSRIKSFINYSYHHNCIVNDNN